MVQQIVVKTDGVPLFVEELVKTTLESGLVREEDDRYVLTGSAPPGDSFDPPRFAHGPARSVVDGESCGTARRRPRAGVCLRRAPGRLAVDEMVLQQGLAELVDAELVYQRGLPPRQPYVFKHALIQDAAYQSLLKSTRQQYHQRIAQVLEAQFPTSSRRSRNCWRTTTPRLGSARISHSYWQGAGERAIQRSANPEAVRHLTTGLELLATLPETPVRAQQELDLLIALGPTLMAIKGQASLEVEETYARARALCTQVGDTSQLAPTLRGLCRFYRNRGALLTARELGEQLYRLAQREAEPAHLLMAP